jgi:SAM-dependent methyltransferase
MPNLFEISSKLRRRLLPMAGPNTRKTLRQLGMTMFTLPPYLAYRRGQLIRNQSGLSPHDKAMLNQINCRISTSDTMFEGNPDEYFLVGLSGLRAIEAAVAGCPGLKVGNILDLPCGCGRVGRFLAARFPEARITACDLQTEGVDFCADALGMTPVYSAVDLDKLKFAQKFDLIWCGSLLTHLDVEPMMKLLRVFAANLSDNGVAVFTTHGDFVAEKLAAGEDCGVGAEEAGRVLELYRSQGHGFAPYLGAPKDEQYGFAATSPDWMRSQCAQIGEWNEAFFQPRGWNNHQDVFGFVRKSK